MNIVVVGLGSMGKRRIRLIREMYPEYAIVGIDAKIDRQDSAKKLYGIETFSSIDEASKTRKFDCVFVCTSPLSHKEIIEESLEKHWNVFTELNLVSDGYENNMELAKKNECILFLSSTDLYREEIGYIHKKVKEGGRWNYIYHIGQYLPNWHPWENYNDFFISDKRTNGCREIMAIEFPWLINTFGEVISSNVIADRITDLKIDYNDNYIIQLTHENGNKGVFIVDVVSPCAVSELEIYGENKYLRWNGTPESLFEYDPVDRKLKNVILNEQLEHVEGYADFIAENSYKNEIREFFDVVSHKVKQSYGFEQDMKILKLIDFLEGYKDAR